MIPNTAVVICTSIGSMRQIIPLSFIFLFSFLGAFSQRQYAFNTPGSSCYLPFLSYAPNGNYTSVKRPILIVSGSPGESLDSLFASDTLRSVAAFSNYLFVYLGSDPLNPQRNFPCMDAFMSYMTYNYFYGKTNLFLYIRDTAITSEHLAVTSTPQIFRSVVLASDQAKNSNASAITTVFQEAYVNYDEEDSGPSSEIDEENTEGSVPVKTYFGPPERFNLTISGKVKDKLSGEPLPFANLIVMGASVGASTNMDGGFTLRNVTSDTAVILVQYVGYHTTKFYLTPKTTLNNITIELYPSSHQLKAFTVVAAKEDVLLANTYDVSMIKITPKKIEQLPNIGEKDILRSFQLMPGISAANESSSGLYVRGGTPDQNLVYFDGFTVYHVDHLYGFFSAFNANALKDVQVYKGGFESRFGGRLSSVTEITGKEGNQKKVNIGGDLSFLSMNVFAEIPIGDKFSSIVAFRRSYKGFLYEKIFEKFNSEEEETQPRSGPGGFSQQSNVTNYFYDLNGKFTFRPNYKDVFVLSFFNGTDKLDNSFDLGNFGMVDQNFSMSSTDLTRYGNVGLSGRWSRKINDRFYLNSIASYSQFYSNRDRSQEQTITNSSGDEETRSFGLQEDNTLIDYSFKSELNWDVLRQLQIQTGFFASSYQVDYLYAQNESTILQKEDNGILAGQFLQSKIRLFNDKLSITSGIRGTYYQNTDKYYFEPRLSMVYRVNPTTTLKLATGKFYQYVTKVTREDILSGNKEFWLLSDGDQIPVGRSIHYIAGIQHEREDYLFSVESYYKVLDGLSEYSLRIQANPMSVSYDENFLTGQGIAKGVEFMVQKKSGKLNGWLSYTLAQAQNYFTGYSDSWYPANQDVTHEGKFVLMYNYKRWDFSLTWIYATGRPYTAPSGAYSVTLLDGTEQEYFTVTSKNSLRLPDYHRCDLSANFKLYGAVKKKKEIGYIGFSIFNVYNRKNIWYKQYSILDGEILETDVTYLGFTPNITLSLKLR